MAKQRVRAIEGEAVGVRVSILVDRLTHIKLGVAAALAGQGREVWAAEVLRQAVKGVTIEVERPSTTATNGTTTAGS